MSNALNVVYVGSSPTGVSKQNYWHVRLRRRHASVRKVVKFHEHSRMGLSPCLATNSDVEVMVPILAL